jgi:hypothetical protein
MNAGCAVRLNVGPVIPGAAAFAAAVDNRAAAAITRVSSRFIEVAFFMVIALVR